MERILRLHLTEQPPENARSLLVPVPPDTHFQRFLGLKVTQAEPDFALVTAKNSSQRAAIIKGISEMAAVRTIDFRVELGRFPCAEIHFQSGPSSCLCINDAVRVMNDQIFRNFPETRKRERLSRIVDSISEQFEYMHHEDENMRPSLSCDMLRGDCLDINTVLMQLLGWNEIECAYYIGVFFPEGPKAPVDDWHCWVSTRLNEVEDWDIAHHLKTGRRKVGPALNPVPGYRMAFSTGRWLKFETDGSEIEISHFGAPHWVADGQKCIPAKFLAVSSTLRTETC